MQVITDTIFCFNCKEFIIINKKNVLQIKDDNDCFKLEKFYPYSLFIEDYYYRSSQPINFQIIFEHNIIDIFINCHCNNIHKVSLHINLSNFIISPVNSGKFLKKIVENA